MFHWTDQKIRVHVFYCVLALMAARLMTREAERAGLHMSVRELLGALAEVQETVLVYQGERGRPRARRVTTEMSATQQRLFELFGLGAYARHGHDRRARGIAAGVGEPRRRPAVTPPGLCLLPRPAAAHLSPRSAPSMPSTTSRLLSSPSRRCIVTYYAASAGKLCPIRAYGALAGASPETPASGNRHDHYRGDPCFSFWLTLPGRRSHDRRVEQVGAQLALRLVGDQPGCGHPVGQQDVGRDRRAGQVGGHARAMASTVAPET